MSLSRSNLALILDREIRTCDVLVLGSNSIRDLLVLRLLNSRFIALISSSEIVLLSIVYGYSERS